MNIANQILYYYECWEKVDKNVLVSQIEKYVSEEYPECKNLLEHGTTRGSSAALMGRIMEMTDSKKDSVYSWINRSRTSVKIPFLKLCKLASALNVELEKFLISEVNE